VIHRDVTLMPIAAKPVSCLIADDPPRVTVTLLEHQLAAAQSTIAVEKAAAEAARESARIVYKVSVGCWAPPRESRVEENDA
jgi:hypothetical protein